METKTETQNQNVYCIWNFPANVYWDKKIEATQKCLDCPADKEYCNLARFMNNPNN